MVAIDYESFEGVQALSVDNTVLKPWQQEMDAILAYTEDALDVLAIFAMVTHESAAADANYFQLMLVAISKQVPRHRLGDEVNALHLLWGLCEKLLRWERSSFESIICLDVFNIWVSDLASVELKLSHFRLFLYDYRRHSCRLIFSLEVWLLPIALRNFLDYCDEEAACVLVVRHDSQALWQLAQNLLIVMAAEHGLS